MLIVWNPIIPKNGEFLRDEKGAFIPKNEIIEAIQSALIFYLIKKDKSLEHLVKRKVLNIDTKPKLISLAKDIKNIIFKKYPVSIEIDDKIYLPEDGIKKRAVERFDFQTKEFVERFESEMFKGIIRNFEIKSDNPQRLKTALLSYARGLAEQEHKALEGTILEEYIVQIQNSIANEWQNALRIGEWTKTPYKGDLLFFWRVKEVREKLLKEFHLDIRHKDILFVPKLKEFVGWCEWRD